MALTVEQKVEKWLTGNYDQETKNAILSLQSKSGDELADCFYKNLEIVKYLF